MRQTLLELKNISKSPIVKRRKILTPTLARVLIKPFFNDIISLSLSKGAGIVFFVEGIFVNIRCLSNSLENFSHS
jgi:hypothetical protein